MNRTPAIEEAAKGWIAYWRHQLETGEFPEGEGDKPVGRIVREDPSAGMSVILAILESIDADPSSRLFQVLAAGPLEDLLAHHGAAVVAQVEAEAKSNPRFSLLLGGVWQNQMPDHVWSRVQASRSEVW